MKSLARQLAASAEFMRARRVRSSARRVVIAQQRVARSATPATQREELLALRAFFTEAGPMFARANDGESE